MRTSRDKAPTCAPESIDRFGGATTYHAGQWLTESETGVSEWHKAQLEATRRETAVRI